MHEINVAEIAIQRGTNELDTQLSLTYVHIYSHTISVKYMHCENTVSLAC